MPSILRQSPQVRLGLMLLAAFAITGLAAGATVLVITLRHADATSREQLSTLANLAAMQVDGDAHKTIGQPKAADPQRLARMQVQVADIRADLRQVREVYTLVPTRYGFEYVLDASFGPRRRPVLSRFTRPTSAAHRAFVSGQTAVEPILMSDNRGTFLAAYSPIKDSSGKVVALLGVDQDTATAVSTLASLGDVLWLTFATVALLGCLSAIAVTRHLTRSKPLQPWLKSLSASTPLMRATVLELILAGITMIVLISGVYGYLAQAQAQTQLAASLRRSDQLETMRTSIERMIFAGETSPEATATLKRRALQMEMRSVLEALELATNNRRSALAEQPFRKALVELQQSLESEATIRDDLQATLNTRNQSLSIAFCVASMLALGSLIMVRAAAGQQQELIHAQLDSERHQGAYQQVADNVPAGLFTFRDGSLRYTNELWDTQTQRVPTEERTPALVRSLHPEDRDKFVTGLRDAERRQEAWECQYRLIFGNDDVRYMEARGVPQFDPGGRFEHILGFAIDVTGRVKSQQQLEERSREVLAKNVQLHEALSDLEENFQAMVHSLVKAEEAKDPYTAGHSNRVMGYSLLIGEVLELSESELRDLGRATLIHDIGKIGVPDAILTKPGPLTDEEFTIVKQHPVIGLQMIQGIPLFQSCMPIVVWHHERLDGSGYPDGLTADQIPLLVRISSVADCFDAMTSNRAYRDGIHPDRALEILRADAAAGKLDAKIVEILASIVERDGLLWHAPTDLAA
ncbi:MAG: HD domain-containing protein [Fimbriimonas ginsengisoli]|uniref:HD domain-containing protein n=1 Tax=Fimbriimonas ginsengisoli TaxID=1005039 RepID=A0A931LTU9_FIMGI|nr:HD domain-containing protein [Fimbriimonas ginsengisoli]